MLVGIGNDRYLKLVFRYIKTSKTDSIYRHTPFFNHKIVRLIEYESKEPTPLRIFNGENASGLIYMALYHMTIKSPIGNHAPF